MKRWLVIAALLGSILSAATGTTQTLNGQARAEAAGHDLIGSPAPPLVLHTIDGETLDLTRLYGKKAVYLKFWATWCVPCRQQMPHFEHVYETAGRDLQVVAIDVGFNDSLADVQTYRRKVGIKMPIVIDDGHLGQFFNLRVTPTHVIIGRDGRIQYIGWFADERLNNALASARKPASQPGAIKMAAAGDVSAGHPVRAPGLALGDRLPDTTVSLLGGASFRMRDANQRQPTILVFLSPWCESYLGNSHPEAGKNCRAVREQVDALIAQGLKVRWLGIASGLWATPDELADYRTQYQTALPLTLDESGALFRSFRVTSVPSVVIADASGRIVRRVEGYDPGLGGKLAAAAR